MATAPKGLIHKLSEITGKVGWIEKTGHNSFQNYDYVTEADMVATLRGHLSERGIVIYPSVEKVTIQDAREKGVLATIEVTYFVTDGEDQIAVKVAGMGYDNPGDKAVYKAMTGAEKYALKQLFLIPTGDDPERDTDDRQAPGRSGAPSSPPASRSGPSHGGGSGSEKSGERTAGNAGDGAGSSGQRTPTIKYGPGKGKTLAQASDSELVQWTKTMEEAVKKNDPKWHRSNQERLEECKAEWGRRNPWREAWKSVQGIGKEYGLDDEGCQVILKQLGYENADKLTPASVTEFKTALESQSGDKEE